MSVAKGERKRDSSVREVFFIADKSFCAESAFPHHSWRQKCLCGGAVAGVGEFVEMEVGKMVVVDDPAGAFFFTAYDANHCLGPRPAGSPCLARAVDAIGANLLSERI